MSLPQKLKWDDASTKWATAIDPVLSSSIVAGSLLTGVSLVSGATVVNHKLGRKLQGWIIVGISAAATVHDNQASNQTPDKTLILVSSAAAVANLWVF